MTFTLWEHLQTVLLPGRLTLTLSGLILNNCPRADRGPPVFHFLASCSLRNSHHTCALKIKWDIICVVNCFTTVSAISAEAPCVPGCHLPCSWLFVLQEPKSCQMNKLSGGGGSETVHKETSREHNLEGMLVRKRWQMKINYMLPFN